MARDVSYHDLVGDNIGVLLTYCESIDNSFLKITMRTASATLLVRHELQNLLKNHDQRIIFCLHAFRSITKNKIYFSDLRDWKMFTSLQNRTADIIRPTFGIILVFWLYLRSKLLLILIQA